MCRESLTLKAIESARGNIASSKGLGEPLITQFLAPALGGKIEELVRNQLANLKASGHYARIIGEVQKEIEEEHAAEIAELARIDAERAAAEEERLAAEERRRNPTRGHLRISGDVPRESIQLTPVNQTDAAQHGCQSD